MPDGHAFDERNDRVPGLPERPAPSSARGSEPGRTAGGALAGDVRLSMRASAAPILATLQRQAGIERSSSGSGSSGFRTARRMPHRRPPQPRRRVTRPQPAAERAGTR